MVDFCEREFGRPASVEPITEHVKTEGSIYFDQPRVIEIPKVPGRVDKQEVMSPEEEEQAKIIAQQRRISPTIVPY